MEIIHKIEERQTSFTSPDGALVTVNKVILATNKPTDALFGVVKWRETEDGRQYLDYSDIEDLTPNQIDFPAGMEVQLMACDTTHPKLPVLFNHPGIGNYRGVWIRREDLTLISGGVGEDAGELPILVNL